MIQGNHIVADLGSLNYSNRPTAQRGGAAAPWGYAEGGVANLRICSRARRSVVIQPVNPLHGSCQRKTHRQK